MRTERSPEQINAFGDSPVFVEGLQPGQPSFSAWLLMEPDPAFSQSSETAEHFHYFRFDALEARLANSAPAVIASSLVLGALTSSHLLSSRSGHVHPKKEHQCISLTQAKSGSAGSNAE